MVWGRLDDAIIDHPKFAALLMNDKLKPLERLAAVGLWTKANAYCNKHLTDGFIPRGIIPLLAGVGPPAAFRLAQALIDARGRSEYGLWEVAGDDYQVHDWHDWNRSRENVESIRAVKATAGRVGGVRSGEARRQAKSEAHEEAHGEAKTNSHPIPSHPNSSGSTPGETTARAREGTSPMPVGNLIAVASGNMIPNGDKSLISEGKDDNDAERPQPRQAVDREPSAGGVSSPGDIPRRQLSREEQLNGLAHRANLTREQLDEQAAELDRKAKAVGKGAA